MEPDIKFAFNVALGTVFMALCLGLYAFFVRDHRLALAVIATLVIGCVVPLLYVLARLINK